VSGVGAVRVVCTEGAVSDIEYSDEKVTTVIVSVVWF
jgi:hypothetical protein